MVCIIIYGTRLFGSVDYFSIENETYFVHTLFFHCCFCPLGPRESFISNTKSPNTYLLRLPTTVGASIRWAWLRFLSLFVPLIFLCVGGMLPVFATGVGAEDEYNEYNTYDGTESESETGGMKSSQVIMYCLLAVAALLIGVPIAAFVYRPKASPEKKEEYTQLLSAAFMATRIPQLVLPPAPQIIVRTTTTHQYQGYRPMNNEAPPPYM